MSRGSQILESARSEPVVVFMVGSAEISRSSSGADVSAIPISPYGYEPLATGLRSPVVVKQLPDGSLLVGERRGTLKHVSRENRAQSLVLDGSELRDAADSQIVLHGLAVHPEFSRTAFVYVMYTEASASDESVTRVARFRHVANRLGERSILLDEIPARRVAPGGAIGFGPDGKLYVATDDGGSAAGRSDPAVLSGKLLRLNDDGTAASDNPLPSPVIYAGLHRPAALEWHDGPAGLLVVDEALPEAAGDLWRQGLVSVRALAGVSSACVYRGSRFPSLNGKLVIVEGDALGYMDASRAAAGGLQLLLKAGLGRLQVVEAGEDGFLYVATGNTGQYEQVGRDVLVRLAPQHVPR
jgi:glucose/arabinose dehydrogenase